MGNLEQWEMEQKERAYKKLQDDANCAQSVSGMLGRPNECRPTLRDRLKKQIEAAVQERRRDRGANELFDLLCKNPDTARILELVEELHA